MSHPQPTDWKQLYLSLEGRVDLKTWWLKYCLPATVISVIASGIDAAAIMGGAEANIGLASLIATMVLLVPLLVGYVKRAHDRNRSGIFLLLLVVPLLNLWPFVELSFLGGTPGANRYGPAPGAPTARRTRTRTRQAA